MKTLRKMVSPVNQFADCGVSKTKPHEKIVHSGLAITPRDVAQMTAKGLAVNTQNSLCYNDADLPGFDPELHKNGALSPEHMRGMDMNTAWELSQKSQSRFIEIYKKDKQLYG